MNAVCRIVCAGDFDAGLLPASQPGDLLIAADAGLLHLQRAGRAPDLCVGDFDSLGSIPDGCPVIRLPVMKDETDMAAAGRIALERGYRTLEFYGVLGGARFSHSLAAVQNLAWLKKQGADCRIVDRRCTVTALCGQTLSFPAGETGSLSVFALTDSAVVTLRGVLYPLEHYALSGTFPLGVSNSFTGAPAEISCESGIAAAVCEP